MRKLVATAMRALRSFGQRRRIARRTWKDYDVAVLLWWFEILGGYHISGTLGTFGCVEYPSLGIFVLSLAQGPGFLTSFFLLKFLHYGFAECVRREFHRSRFHCHSPQRDSFDEKIIHDDRFLIMILFGVLFLVFLLV